MAREIRIPHHLIDKVDTITPYMEQRFKDEGLDLHVHEVEQMDDDFTRKERILKVKNTRYFFQS